MAGLDQTVRSILAGAPELIHTPGLATGIAQAAQADPTGTIDPYATAQAASVAAARSGVQQGAADIGLNSDDVAPPAVPYAADVKPPAQPKQHHGGGILGKIGSFVHDDLLGMDPHNRGGIGEILHLGGEGLGKAADALNRPLQDVQHLYRADHEYITRYGVGAFLESIVPGLNHTASENASHAWKVTADGNSYRDRYGHAVNPGYDLANVVDHVINGHDYMPAGWTKDANGTWQRTDPGAIDTPTGILNAVFDLSLDPTLKAGRVAQFARMKGIIVGGRAVTLSEDATARAKQLEDLTSSGQRISFTADKNTALVGGRVLVPGRQVNALVDFDGNAASNIPLLYKENGGVRDAFDRLAKADTQTIITQYPMLRPVAGELGKATTGPEVAQVFERAMTVRNYSFVQQGLPTTSLTRRLASRYGADLPTLAQAGQATVDALPSALQTPFKYKPFAVDSRTKQISGKEFDPHDPASLKGIRDALLIGHDYATANAILAKYIDTPELGERVAIYTNAVRDSLRAFGVPDDADIMARWNRDAEFMVRSGMRPVYGTDETGRVIYAKDPETGESLDLGLLNNQTGKLSFPDYREARRAIADMRSSKDPRAWAFKADDWLYHHYTTRIFKNLVLLSLGFAFRVAGGELVPATLQNGAKGVAGSAAMAAAAKLNPTLRDLADSHPTGLVGLAAQTRQGLGRIAATDEEAKRLTVRYADGTEQVHNANTVSLLHAPVADDELRAAAQRFGVQVSSAEVPHYKAAISKALFGVGKALVDKDYRDQAAFNILTLGGHTMAPAVSSAHDVALGGAGRSEDLREYMRQAGARIPDKPQRLKDSFVTWDHNNSNHPMFWHFAVQEMAKDPGVAKGAAAYLDAVRNGAAKEAATAAFIKADKEWMLSPEAEQFRLKMALYGQGPDEFSNLRATAMRGLAYGQNGKLNADVLEGIAGHADVPNVASLAQRDRQFRPLAVKGRELEDIPDPGRLERFSAWGWRTALHPVINSVSRAPLYTMKTAQEYKALKPWVDAGLMDEVEARSIAQVRGIHSMLPLIHNTKLRSQMSDVFANAAPFYFAQEQAYKRYARAIGSNPVAFRRGLLLAHGLSNSGIIRQDEDGQKHIVFPGGGEFAKWATIAASALGMNVQGGVPSVLSGNTISLKTVVPESNAVPSASPLVAIAAKEIEKFFPATEPFLAKAIGPVAQQQSFWDEVIPNATLKRVLQATPVLDREAAFQTSFINSIQYAMHRSEELRAKANAIDPAGNDPRAQALLRKADELFPSPNADPQVKQKALDRLRNTTRVMSIFKALVGVVSPLAPAMDVGDVKLRQEIRDDIKQYGLAEGVQRFMEKNPNATADTVFLSNSRYTGTNLPATADALKWVQDNRGWVQNGHVLAAAYLIPQTAGKYNQEAYNQELAIGLRQRKTPDQMVNAIYAAATNEQFFASLKDYNAMKQQYANDPEKLRQLRESWTAYTQQLSNANPVWYADLNDGTKQQVAQQAMYQVRQALTDPNTPASSQTSIVSDLVSSYDDYAKLVAATRAGQTSYTVSDLKDRWKSFLDQEAKQKPEAQAFINGVLRRLPT